MLLSPAGNRSMLDCRLDQRLQGRGHASHAESVKTREFRDHGVWKLKGTEKEAWSSPLCVLHDISCAERDDD